MATISLLGVQTLDRKNCRGFLLETSRIPNGFGKSICYQASGVWLQFGLPARSFSSLASPSGLFASLGVSSPPQNDHRFTAQTTGNDHLSVFFSGNYSGSSEVVEGSPIDQSSFEKSI